MFSTQRSVDESPRRSSLAEGLRDIGRIFAGSAAEFRRPRSIAMMGMLIALCCVLSYFNIPLLGQALKIKFSYVIYALSGIMFGPVMGMVLGLCDQILVETFLHGNPPTFLWVFSAMLRGMYFGLAFYYPVLQKTKKQLSFLRITLVKLGDNIINNIIINTLLLVYYEWIPVESLTVGAPARIIKNLALFPLEVFVLVIVLRALLPALQKLRLIPDIGCERAGRRQYLLLIGWAALAGLCLVLYLIYKK